MARKKLTPLLQAADAFVIPLIEGARDFEGQHAHPDVTGLALALPKAIQWDGYRETRQHFIDVFPRRKPRPFDAPRVAKVIADGFRDALIDVEMLTLHEIELLMSIVPEAGPRQGARLLRIVEDFVERAPDESFAPDATEPTYGEGWLPRDEMRSAA